MIICFITTQQQSGPLQSAVLSAGRQALSWGTAILRAQTHSRTWSALKTLPTFEKASACRTKAGFV